MGRTPKQDKEVAGTTPAENVTSTNVIPASPEPAKTRPIKSFRVDDIEAAIWSRTTVKTAGPVTYHSITFSRHYVSKGESKWSGFFNPADLSRIVSLCHQAEDYLIDLQLKQTEA